MSVLCSSVSRTVWSLLDVMSFSMGIQPWSSTLVDSQMTKSSRWSADMLPSLSSSDTGWSSTRSRSTLRPFLLYWNLDDTARGETAGGGASVGDTHASVASYITIHCIKHTRTRQPAIGSSNNTRRDT